MTTADSAALHESGRPASTAAARSVSPRKRDAQRTREDILRVATAEFADSGFAGARVDQIAAMTATTKRMIYYYFGSKDGLYLAVMEAAYEVIRRLELDLDVDGLSPVEAIRSLAESTYDHHTSHRDFVRLVAIENVHKAEHIRASRAIQDLNTTAVDTIERVLARGIADGVFRSDVDALDAHMMISAYSVFHVANRYTFQVLFDRDLLDDDRHERYRRLAGDMIVGALTAGC